MLNGLIIRSASTDDVDALVRFSAAMALETEGRRLDETRLRQGTQAVLDSPSRGFYTVAELMDRSPRLVVGQLLVTFEWSDWRNATFWWIQSVYVDAAWRRRGVYRKMHESVLEQARRQGDVCGIRLYVEVANAVAKTVYGKVGLGDSSYQVFENDFVLERKELHGKG
ncbi:MAG: N-acetyltransferase [Nitrospiraceae bacterium]|nr:N-acetyltransferase [Nitrospiraceae bacterium]MSR25151.1 N-acetyltransferase [Nitrospiraceae bacterium]